MSKYFQGIRYTSICLPHLISRSLFLSPSVSLTLIPLFLLPLSPSLPHSPSQQSWKLNPVIFPPTVPFSAHLGVNLYIIQINISVSGEYSESLQRLPPTPNPSILLVLAGVLFCLPEPALMACFFLFVFFQSTYHMFKSNIQPSSSARVCRSHRGFDCSPTLNVVQFQLKTFYYHYLPLCSLQLHFWTLLHLQKFTQQVSSVDLSNDMKSRCRGIPHGGHH